MRHVRFLYFTGVLVLLIAVLTSCTGSLEDKTVEGVGAEVSDSFQAESGEYIIEYYDDIKSEVPSEMTTKAISGEETKLLSLEELGFSKDGYVFHGWRINRDSDGKWFLRDDKGESHWYDLENGELPEGYSYNLRKDGGTLTSPTTGGKVRLYAEWSSVYKVLYYADVDSFVPSDQTTTGVYGQETKLLTTRELGFSKNGYVFEGWRLYRESDGAWFVKDAETTASWEVLENGELPDGWTFALRNDGGTLIAPTQSGNVCLYAQWGPEGDYDTYRIEYYSDVDSTEPSELTTIAAYGIETPLMTCEQLGFEKVGYEFEGWRIYRDMDEKWFLKNEKGSAGWYPLEDGELPSGYSYALRGEDGTLAGAATSGTVRLYAQWKNAG